MAPREPSAWERASSPSSSYFDKIKPELDKYTPDLDSDISIFDFPEALKPGERKTSEPEKNKQTDWSGTFKGLFNKTRDTDKWQSYASQRPSGGEWNKPYSGNVLENLGVVYPQQQSPMFIPGAEGKKGLGGTIGSLVGGIGGALIGGPVGAVLGAAGGPIGSLFG